MSTPNQSRPEINKNSPSDTFGEAPIHLAIVHRRFLRMILDGTKTAEARLSKTRRLPYKGLGAGETVYLKPPGGDLAARAIARRVHRFELTGPVDIRSLRARFGPSLGGPEADGYWDAKSDARYATIIELSGVTRIERTPDWYRPANDRSAWRLLRGA